ncbi:CHAT domain-containing protein [bacterium]|nr:CHAT domain-containing protein [bacterium]NUN45181.1 CHAT domain-containing protein [bacterium]
MLNESNPRGALHVLDSLISSLSNRTDSMRCGIEYLRIGVFYQNINDYASAIDPTRKSQQIFLNTHYPDWLVYALSFEAHYKLMLNEYSSSLLLLHEAIKIARADSVFKKKPHPYYSTLNRLGLVNFHLGNYREALACFDSCNIFFERLHDEYELSSTYLQMGRIFRETNEFRKSEEYFNRVLAMSSKLHIQPNDRKLSAYSGIAELYYKQNKYEEAIKNQLRSVEEIKTLKSEADVVYSELGYYYERIGKWDKASVSYKTALNLLMENWTACSGLARVAESQSKIEEADSLYRRSIMLATKKAELNKGISIVAISKNIVPAYLHAARFYARQGKTQVAFNLIENTKSLYSSKLLRLSGNRSLKALSDSLSSIDRRIRNIFGQYQNHPIALHEARIWDTERVHLLDSLLFLEDSAKSPFENTNQSSNALKDALGQSYQLIEYGLCEDSLISFFITGDTMKINISGIRKDSLIRWAETVCTNQTTDEVASRKLYNALIHPFEDILDKNKTLIVVPDGPLTRLPFELLLSSDKPNDILLRHYPIVYAISASFWLDRVRRFSNAPRHYAGFAFASSSLRSDLPYTEKQMISSSNTFDKSRYWVNHLSVNEIISHIANYKIIDFATHAVVSDIEPMYSQIFFSDHSSLKMYDIYDFRIDADLVVLSACRTGLGKPVAGEGLMGFNQAFAYAGAYSLIMSAWDIDDEATAMIMSAFYEGIASGLTRAEALRQAKLKYINEAYELKQSPYYWAGLMLWGNPETIPLHRVPYEFIAFLFIPFAIIIVSPFIGRLRKKKKY